MLNFSQSPKRTQQWEPARSSTTRRSHSGQSAAVSSILHLQRTTGNHPSQQLLKNNEKDLQASPASNTSIDPAHDVSQLPVRSNIHGNIQPKLKVNASGDVYEREADYIATHVMNMGNLVAPRSVPQKTAPVENESGAQSQPVATSITPLVQRDMMPEEDEELIQTRLSLPPAEQSIDFESGNRLETWLTGRSRGSPLPHEVRTFMESRFSADFGRVRVHTDKDAVQMSRALNAQAFTHGENIYFGAGKSAGRNALTAHELTHVLQQTGGGRSQEAAHVPAVQREVQVRPPGRGEASAFDRRQELIDRMNGLSAGMEYRLEGRVIRYNEIDATALTPFDRRMQGFIDRAAVVPMRLITGAGYVGGGPLLMDSLQLGYVDLDDLMASDDLGFQSVIIHFLTERFNVRNYARRLGMANVGAEWSRVHPLGIRAEAAFLQDLFNDPSIHHNWVNETATRLISAFRSRDERYHIFIIIRGGGRERRGAEISVKTRDGRRMSAEDFLAVRAAAAP